MVEEAPSQDPLIGTPDEVALFLIEHVTPERLEILQETCQNEVFGEVWLAAAMLHSAERCMFINNIKLNCVSAERHNAYLSRIADLYIYACSRDTSPLN